ncbi:cupin domain-containing protein [Luteimonas sp. SJ-92]|uniref:Cupin domain-containing protein n=1 Tax=Luteimonas salinisoli TaxID=2752307 RepID=A0A853JAF3_9GAMM|nr:cupin domain-containing protein [Luteimonas salinisoli]NZA26171.1 cupin domain-containing protein [Luteimonas salinisoli]
MRHLLLAAAFAALLLPAVVAANTEPNAGADGSCDVEAAVRAWADDWRESDAAGLTGDIVFELEVTDTGQAFAVELTRGGDGRIVAAAGDAPATRFKATRAVYCDLASGRMNVLTTMGKAKASDPVPMEVDVGEEYAGGGRVRAELIPAWFRFFTMGAPEVVRFGFGHGREVHGGHAVPLYYGEGLRTAWYGLEPGMHVNSDPSDQSNEFDSIFIVLAGELHARFDGNARVLTRGDSVFVPAGMRHEFWVEQGRGEFLVVMAGEGA